jgi:NADPH:quinone reductase-like Zn-dependent oxidoreductase
VKAYTVIKYAEDGLQPTDIPRPTIGENEVLVQVAAASINPLDKMIRNGELKQLLKYKKPFVLGHDMAGTITEIGSKVSNFKIGDEIYARPRDLHIGTFAEYIAINTADIALKPRNLTFIEAAAVPLVGLASWQALVEYAHVKAGDKILIHAGAGGLGSTAVQLGHQLGAEVATTVSSRNVALAKKLGANAVIDYTKEDFSIKLSNYDFVLDTVGGPNLQKSLKVLKPGGLVISVVGPPDSGFAKQLGAALPIRFFMSLLSRKVRKQANDLGVKYQFVFMQASGSQLDTLRKLYETKELVPVIDRTFSFDETLDAIAYVEHGKAKSGKVVIVVKSDN